MFSISVQIKEEMGVFNMDKPIDLPATQIDDAISWFNMVP
jgi:hypothetical protein